MRCSPVRLFAPGFAARPLRLRDRNHPSPLARESSRQISWPLFQAKCLRCHGEKSKKAELDLRTRAGILKGSESGPVRPSRQAGGKPAV